MDNELTHYGVLGMKWGVRKSRASKGGTSHNHGRQTGTNKKKNVSPTKTAKKSIKDMSDDELRNEISRLELEKRYKDLTSPKEQTKIFNGKKFVTDILNQSGKNVGTQVATYYMGKAFNSVVGSDVVNVKKTDGK